MSFLRVSKVLRLSKRVDYGTKATFCNPIGTQEPADGMQALTKQWLCAMVQVVSGQDAFAALQYYLWGSFSGDSRTQHVKYGLLQLSQLGSASWAGAMQSGLGASW